MAKHTPKSSKVEVDKRIQEVLAIRLDGAQHWDVVRYANDPERNWGVSERQIWTYIRRADNLIVKHREKSRKRLISKHLAQRCNLFARALNAADYRTALAILADKAKLEGLYPEKETRELLKLAVEQQKRIDELEQRLHVPTTPTGPEERRATEGDGSEQPAEDGTVRP